MLPPLSEAEMLLRSNKTTRIYLVYTAAVAATTRQCSTAQHCAVLHFDRVGKVQAGGREQDTCSSCDLKQMVHMAPAPPRGKTVS